MNDDNKVKKVKKKRIIDIVVLLIVVAIFVAATIYLFPIIKNISTKEGQIEFKQKIDNLGIWGILMLFALELAQIFFVILPGEPIEILAGMCWGTVGGTVFITVSVFIITWCIFMLVRKLGRKFVYDSFDKEKIEKLENSKLLKNPKTVEKILVVLFFIPGTPKDLLVYLGGLLPIKPLRFTLISTFARFPSVISSTIAGANLVNGNIQISIIVYIVTFIITAITLFFINIFDKDHKTKETFEALK